MDLSGLLPLTNEIPAYRQLIEMIRKRESALHGFSLGLLPSARPYIIAALQMDLGMPILVVVGRVERAREIHSQIKIWSGKKDFVLLFPEPEPLPYERTPWTKETISERLRVLATLSTSPPPLIITSARALMQKTIPLREFKAFTLTLREGQTLRLRKIESILLSSGYERVSVVEGPAEFSRRGGIVDFFPPSSALPVRIELFGSEIDSLRLFDPSTQRSIKRIKSFLLSPASEALPKYGPLAANRLISDEKADDKKFLEEGEALRKGQRFMGMEFYIPYFYQEAGILVDYLPEGGLLLVDDLIELEEAMAELEEEALELRDESIKSGEIPNNFATPYFTWEEVRDSILDRGPLLLGYDDVEGSLRDAFSPGPRYRGMLKQVFQEWRRMRREGNGVVVVSRQANRLATLWGESESYIAPVEEIKELPSQGSLTIVKGTLAEGWVLSGGSDSAFYLLTDAEIFGWSRPWPRRARRAKAISPEAFFSDIRPDDYVVHIEHGIGVFKGLVKTKVEGVEREYIRVDYAAGDRLYVPIHHADRLSRYVGTRECPPKIHRLGTADWAITKRHAKRAVEEVAKELLELYSAREVVEGHAFSPDTPWQAEFEASFPYFETEGQLKALDEIKKDMESPKPMDRLVCGDVGYGKTEVALRAAFKAVMDGKQVALLVPTTVLAQQHFHTFKRRLEPFPVEVRMLSRFCSKKEQREIIKGLGEGKVDIVIGTHRLLSNDVSFKDLGLLIIDEEQRFGVTHKERLKQMRKEVDVLTMTATPIPRTLYMALSGLRDMSTIDTPPEERLPIKTYVGEYDESLIRKAILRELRRGGQVYFVHNRVESINIAANRLKRVVPEANLAIAHGRMKEAELANVMLDFASGGIDVLVCTSIIESGLDIPNVNTIIVDRADRFGLADLYQLRGRVGRGAVQAYAYFFYDNRDRMTDEARKRLQTILEASELGAGFGIAMRDLEIRGAGEILGTRQHGHIAGVGFDLYCKLLAQAVNELKKGGKPQIRIPSHQFVSIDLPLDVYLPEDYVPSQELRLKLYRRLAGLKTIEEIKEMEEELEDRFGALPQPVRNLLYQLRLKVLAIEAGVKAISVEEGGILITLSDEVDRRKQELLFGGRAKIEKGKIWLPASEIWREELLRILSALPSFK